MRGKLFTRDFLSEGVTETSAWRDLDEADADRFATEVRRLLDAFPVDGTPNESTTEQDLIEPVLDALGWHHFLPQQTTSGRGRRDVPDLLLFPDAAAKTAAQAESQEAHRYRHGVAVLEAKRWQRPLDRGEERRGQTSFLAEGAPSTQMLRYLSRAETVSNGAVRWGLLTNGRLWRLYFQGARSRSEEFLEMDLAALAGANSIQLELESPPSLSDYLAGHREHHLRVFYLLFRRRSFLPQPDDPQRRSFHQLALEESRLWEERVSTELGKVVFDTVFPGLLQSLLNHDPQAPSPPTPAYLDELRRAGLTFLYRLLFVLYAEDRNLLPATDRRYDDYSLRQVRQELRRRLDERDAFSQRAATYWGRLQGLFRAVSEGDSGIGLPPYDGGLFEPGRHPLLERVSLPDAELVPLLDALSRRQEGGLRRWINYRDLSVQQLGSIYERFLEYEPVVEDGRVALRLNLFARKTSGSYYTHDDLVRLILERTVGPLLEEVRTAFDDANERLAGDRRPKAERLAELATFDQANRILDLQVCDPAMGSGHFLVSLVDYLADEVLEAMAKAESEVEWAPEESPYESPVAGRIETIRSKILDNARSESWRVGEDELDDRHIVRRVILKRVIYGVDKNPMAVELAKVSLWLHTFTTGAPLSFLDHHLRCGDSLYGEWLEDAQALFDLNPLFMADVRSLLGGAATTMNEIARISDDDIAEVRQSRQLYQDAEAELQPLHRLLDLWHAQRWLRPSGGTAPGLASLVRGSVGDLVSILEAGHVDPEATKAPAKEVAAVNDFLAAARHLVERERFLHWELAFPTVWKPNHRGGFDAVIGNPPWDRLKLQQVEWFAARRPEIALASRAADRKKRIAALEKRHDPLWDGFQEASLAAETAARVARECGHYPLLARGDLNIYPLFVERAQELVRPEGVIGLLVPSGIASDKTSSEFFRGISTGGRLGALFDFENKKVFFPDVDSRFKFSVFVYGGPSRRFEQAECAFFLHAVAELKDEQRSFPLGPENFAAVNPNTGTAPIFRTRRDAEITTAVYERLPVLVDRSGEEPVKAWPVDYTTMFHMTNDSGLFKTRAELEEEGFYPVGGNRWKRGEAVVVPLYEGKMVQMYDHRAASIEIHPENVHRPAQPVPATEDEHGDPEWLPEPQFWVDQANVALPTNWAVAFKDVTAPTNERTMIAAVVPGYGLGNTLPALLPEAEDQPSEVSRRYAAYAPLLLANLNSFAFDFVARQKVQGQHLNLYIVEQLPVVPAAVFEQTLGGHHLGDFVRDQVLRLSYTATDLAPFARDLGYEGDPFPWDEEDRLHRRARLDALFFHLYGLTPSDADYILNQFPIVRESDEKHHGRYLTRDLVMAYMRAVEARDLAAEPRL